MTMIKAQARLKVLHLKLGDQEMKMLLLTVAAGLVLAQAAHAQSPREQLNAMVQQLQKNPSDDALREKIIKLARGVKPAPVMPEAANRHLARGAAAFKEAKNPDQFKDAIREFEQASLHAPWSGDIYFNLGLAQDKAGDHTAAVRSLKLSLSASPNNREVQNLLYEVEYKQEKKAAEESKYTWMLGNWTSKMYFSNGGLLNTRHDLLARKSGSHILFDDNLRATIQSSGEIVWEHKHTSDDWHCPKERGWLPTTVSISPDLRKISYAFRLSRGDECSGPGDRFSMEWMRQ